MAKVRLDEVTIFEQSMVFSEEAPLDGEMHQVETINMSDDDALNLLKKENILGVRLTWVDNISESRKTEVQKKFSNAQISILNQ